MDAACLSVGFHGKSSFLCTPSLPASLPLRLSDRKFCDSSTRVDVRCGPHRSHCHLFRAVPQQNSQWVPQEEPENSVQVSHYHPSEEMAEPLPVVQGEVQLTEAEMARTIIEVNSKATLLFSALINDEVQENIFWPDLSYLTDENGDIFFEVKDEEDVLQELNADDKLVQVFVGFDNIERLAEMELMEPSNVDFGIEEITNEDGDNDDDYEENYVTVLNVDDGDEANYVDDDDDDDDDNDDDGDDGYSDDDGEHVISSELFDDWASFETMKSSHPMFFAKKISEVVSSIHLDWMEQPPASLVVQGLLRPALFGDNSLSQKSTQEELMERGDVESGTSFYKLDILNIHLVSSYGNQSSVKIEDYRIAQPDLLAHQAAKIICRLKSIGDKFVQALKSLCWRSKGIQVEEVYFSGLDSLGFDLRVCSGTQIQTLRFSFRTQATSEYSAERQLHEILFPRNRSSQQQQQEAHYKE